jgi:hypothetical protein
MRKTANTTAPLRIAPTYRRMTIGTVFMRSRKSIPPMVRMQNIRAGFQHLVLNVTKISGQIFDSLTHSD